MFYALFILAQSWPLAWAVTFFALSSAICYWGLIVRGDLIGGVIWIMGAAIEGGSVLWILSLLIPIPHV